MKSKNGAYDKSKFFLKINQALWRNPFLQKLRAVYYFIDVCILKTVKKPKPQSEKKKSVLVMYNLALGDGIMFLGIHKALRNIYPSDKYKLSIVCQSPFVSLYKSSGIYDEVIGLDFMSATVNLRKRRILFQRLRQKYYDILIDPIGCEACTTNVFATAAVCATEKIGAIDVNLPLIQTPKLIRKKVYTRVIEIKNEKPLHLIQFYNEFFKKLGNKSGKEGLAVIEKTKLNFNVPEKFFIIFPAASMAVKSWSCENFAELALKIQKETNMPLVVCGTEHDRPKIQEMLKNAKGINYIDYVGKTTIPEFIELIGRASLVLTNDTSAYHIAVAKQVLTFLICGGYTYDRYANYNYDNYKKPHLICYKMDCYNCNNFCEHTGFDRFPCIENITVDYAWKEIYTTIKNEGLIK